MTIFSYPQNGMKYTLKMASISLTAYPQNMIAVASVLKSKETEQMTIQIDNITFRRNIDRAASWRVWLNGIFIGNVHTDAIARALRASRQHHA